MLLSCKAHDVEVIVARAMNTATHPSSALPLLRARRVVVKVGSALLVDAQEGSPNRTWLEALAADVAAMRARGQSEAGYVVVDTVLSQWQYALEDRLGPGRWIAVRGRVPSPRCPAARRPSSASPCTACR